MHSALKMLSKMSFTANMARACQRIAMTVKVPLTSVIVKDKCNMTGRHNVVKTSAMKPNSSSTKMMKRIRNEWRGITRGFGSWNGDFSF
ncbi:hypothetical protein AGABI2DRAFT_192245 [Agaricus bisporus var. bisporus H97]|uniref:hypothetical protein n=1 Tax=Agaricus bisporus var. bisporus (strain H97 / ATCC MYA-4626 / FGSC 10389) TaxID=936046 RepID=UPI00029F7CF1|nr:hypothetical protein AGABI2DRAFT_192245 [Agaricus bisporus var. bisporus H97]EKV48724.1 hypothetical protein AGABI2DRAFT_192245 [Agaricus bisporus var. bisporus H97]